MNGEDFAAEDALRKRLNETIKERDALAKRVEELEDVIVRRYIPDIFDEAQRIATRRAGRAK